MPSKRSSAEPSAERLSVRLGALGAEVRAAATEAGMTVADYHRHALRQALDHQRGADELAAVEQRLAAQMSRLHRRMGQLLEVQQLQFAYLDQFAKLSLSLEPELPDDAARAAAISLGHLRHQGLVSSIPAAMQGSVPKIFAAVAPGISEDRGE